MTEIAVPRLDLKKCTHCGACLDVCPESALSLSDEHGLEIDAAKCTYCGNCEETCPEGAIALVYTIRWA